MKKLVFFASLVSLLMVGTYAEAQSRYNNPKQQVRIQNGVRHGQLTKHEAHQLRSQQRQIKTMKRMAMADGIVTPRERMMIRKAERRANVNIYHQKHDRQVRW